MVSLGAVYVLVGAPLITKASLVAQTGSLVPTKRKARVQFLGWEDTLEKGMATHSSILAWRILDRGVWGATVYMGLQTVKHD